MKRLMFSLILCLASIVAFANEAKEALSNPGRPAADVSVDEFRKPDQVLTFLGVESGMAVFDVFAGGGYYTEILSYLVGDQGRVVHYNNKPWADFVKKATDKWFSDGRLAAVEQLVATSESLLGRAAEFDAAIFIMGMHDIYYADPDTGWVAIDGDKFTQGIYDLLKPGSVLGIIDHNAVAGSDPEVVGETLHRVDPARIISDLEAIGFVL